MDGKLSCDYPRVRPIGKGMLRFGIRATIDDIYEKDAESSTKENLKLLTKELFPNHEISDIDQRKSFRNYLPFCSTVVLDTLFTLSPIISKD